MQEYLKNIVKRIQVYSRELDTTEVFVDKKWIYIDDLKRQHQYTFLRDKRLVMSAGGMTKTGTWDLLPTKQLLINRITDEILLDKYFIEKALLVMKLTGSDDEPFVLINKDEIPDLNVEAYLERYERDRDNNSENSSEEYNITSSGQLSGARFYIGLIIKLQNGSLLNGTYQTTRNDVNQFVELQNNVINRLYFLIQYKHNDTDISIEQVEPFAPQVGDKVKFDSNILTPPSLTIKVISTDEDAFTLTCNRNGKIIVVKRHYTTVDLAFFSMLALLLLFTIIWLVSMKY